MKIQTNKNRKEFQPKKHNELNLLGAFVRTGFNARSESLCMT